MSMTGYGLRNATKEEAVEAGFTMGTEHDKAAVVQVTRLVKFDEDKNADYNSLRPSMAFSMVTSSAYSMSLPAGMPVAMRVTFTPGLLIRPLK
jgi:hypothetical protein